MASVIKVLLERRCLTAFRSPVFDTTSPGGGRQTETAQNARHGNLTPPRISPSCPMKMAGQEYHYCLTGSLRNSLSCCFVDGWVPLAALHWPSFMRKPHRRVLAHPPASLCACWRSVRERISVAGCDRAGPVFFKVRRGYGTTPSLLSRVREGVAPNYFYFSSIFFN